MPVNSKSACMHMSHHTENDTFQHNLDESSEDTDKWTHPEFSWLPQAASWTESLELSIRPNCCSGTKLLPDSNSMCACNSVFPVLRHQNTWHGKLRACAPAGLHTCFHSMLLLSTAVALTTSLMLCFWF